VLIKSYRISCEAVLDELRELLLVSILIILEEMPHVVGNVDTEDVLAVNLGVELLGFIIVARESLGGVRDINAAINGTLHGTKNSGTGGGPGKASVQAGAESSRTIGVVFDHEVVSVNLDLALIDTVQVQPLKDLFKIFRGLVRIIKQMKFLQLLVEE